MFKRTAIYPFLFILYIVLNPLVANIDQINPNRVWRPLFVLLLVAAAIVLLFRAIFKDWHFASYLSLLGLFLFFAFGHLNNIAVENLPEGNAETYPWIVMGILVAVVVLLGLRKTWNRLGGASRLTPLLNLVFVIAFLSQALFGLGELAKKLPNPIWRSVEAYFLADTGEGDAETDLALDCSISPDIYFIVLDGYGRADVLKDIYDVDTSPFLASLQEKGFYIADQSHSNYIQTVYAIPSPLYFNYLEPMPAKASGYDYFPELIAGNPVMDLLRQCGYQVVSFETGFVFTNYTEADRHYAFGSELNELEELLLAGTPLGIVLDKIAAAPPKRSYESHRARVHFTFDKLAELPEMTGPKFVFAHIISPHPPFVFDAQGNPVQPKRSYSIADGNDYRGSWGEYRRGYAAQVQYVNQLIEQTVDAIINNSSSPPVIILQGDHGPGGFLEWKTPDQTCLWERTSIINAYYLPDGGAQQLYPAISPVNSFRVVLNSYFGTDLKLLPDETYFTNSSPGGAFIDITDRQESKDNCP